MCCFPYVKYLVDECTQVTEYCLHFRKSSMTFTIRWRRWYFTACFSVSSEKIGESKTQKLIVLSISPCCLPHLPGVFMILQNGIFWVYSLYWVKMLAGQSVYANYIKFLGDVMGIREKTKMFSNQNYPHFILIKLIFTEASWKPVLHFLMMR